MQTFQFQGNFSLKDIKIRLGNNNISIFKRGPNIKSHNLFPQELFQDPVFYLVIAIIKASCSLKDYQLIYNTCKLKFAINFVYFKWTLRKGISGSKPCLSPHFVVRFV